MDHAIDIQGLTHRFGDIVAVDGVSATVARGEVFGLVGPDGAGKSTLIRMLATVMPPHEGDAFVMGASVSRQAKAVKPRIGYMSQRFSLYRDLTVRENLDFFADLRGMPRRERSRRAQEALAFSGLERFADRHAEHLSGGMKQKLALAVTLMHEPDLLLLDEPTTGVDPVSRREFWRIIASLHRRGITVLVATPYMDEAERCTRIAFMESGRFLVCDTPTGLKRRVPGRLIELETGLADQRAAMAVTRAVPGVTSVVVFGEAIRVLVEDNGPDEFALVAALEAAGVRHVEARRARIDMETAFSYLLETERARTAALQDGDAA